MVKTAWLNYLCLSTKLFSILNSFHVLLVQKTLCKKKRIESDRMYVKKGKTVEKCVVYWPPTPPNMPFQRWRKCIFHWRGRAWLTIWDRVKIPRYSHSLIHRKRVTCELHDSYFRLMTIKDAIPRDWVGGELLYNWVRRKFN